MVLDTLDILLFLFVYFVASYCFLRAALELWDAYYEWHLGPEDEPVAPPPQKGFYKDVEHIFSAKEQSQHVLGFICPCNPRIFDNGKVAFVVHRDFDPTPEKQQSDSFYFFPEA